MHKEAGVTAFHTRPMESDDRSRVWQWWLRTLRKSAPSVGHKAMARAVDELIEGPEVEILIGEHPGAAGAPLGFLAHRDAELLMVFVVDNVEGIPVRRNGLASLLLDEAMGDGRVEVKHWTSAGAKLMESWRGRRAAA